MKLMRTEDAVGQILCHDITRIVKDGEKGPVFRKGHVIREEDIEVLLAVGKDHVYIWENNENMMHENDAAMVLCGLCRNEFMHPTEIKEGKTELVADIDGLLKVDSGKLQRINSQGQMMIATRHGNTVVRAGDRLAGMRVIPLVIGGPARGNAGHSARHREGKDGSREEGGAGRKDSDAPAVRA